MTPRGTLVLWVKNEAQSQKDKLEKLKMSGFGKVTGYDVMLRMRKELVEVTEKYQKEIESLNKES